MSTNTAQDAQLALSQLIAKRKRSLRDHITCMSISWKKLIWAWQAEDVVHSECSYIPKIERRGESDRDATCVLVHVIGDINVVNALKLPSEILGVKVVVQLRHQPKR